MKGKERIIVIDFSDNFEYGSGYQKKNYLMRHADERQRIYADKKIRHYQSVKKIQETWAD